MSLFWATLVPGLVLLAVGGLLLWSGGPVRRGAFAMLRADATTILFFGGGTAWFLWHVAHLGEADFGNIRHFLLALFGTVALLAFVYVRDFLAVRGLCILMLLSARELLDAAYMHYDVPQRLLLVTLVFVGVVAALYLGALPFRLRDAFEWLFQKGRARLAGGALAGYGLLLGAVAFTY
ncbi:MAG: hypothetical protein ACFB20_00010 [Opitutales bacterium]